MIASPWAQRRVQGFAQDVPRLARTGLTRSCVFAYCGHISHEILSGDKPTVNGSIAKNTKDNVRAWYFPGGSADTTYLGFANHTSVSTTWRGAFTWAFLCRINTAITNASLVAQDGGTRGGMIGYSTFNSRFQTRLYGATADAFCGVASADVPLDKMITVVAVSNGTRADTGLNMYIDGVLKAQSGASASTADPSADATQVLGIGQEDEGKTTDHTGYIALACWFARMWSAGEVAQFHRNPWQLFAPARLPYFAGTLNTTATAVSDPPWYSAQRTLRNTLLRM